MAFGILNNPHILHILAQGDFQLNTSGPKVSGHRILVSADEGVFLAELEDMPAVP